MVAESYSLIELADATGIEARTIRSYIERGLLPGAHARGRGATYSAEHLSRLQVIQALRRARPSIGLSDIRIVLQQLNPEQIHGLAGGSITAAIRAIDDSGHTEDGERIERDGDEGEVLAIVDWEQTAAKLTGVERLVRLLREVSAYTSPSPRSKMEGWKRIAVTPDVELSVRAEFDVDQLAAFQELADVIRHLLQNTDALTGKDDG